MISEHGYANAYVNLSLDLALSTARYNILDNRAEDVVNTFAMAKKGFESGALKPEAAMSMVQQAIDLLASIREVLQTRS